jgi:hypothetical protein
VRAAQDAGERVDVGEIDALVSRIPLNNRRQRGAVLVALLNASVIRNAREHPDGAAGAAADLLQASDELLPPKTRARVRAREAHRFEETA